MYGKIWKYEKNLVPLQEYSVEENIFSRGNPRAHYSQ